MKQEILDALKKAAKDGWISCTVARKLAEELGVPPLEIGEAANILKIKIKFCELGCF